MCGVDVLPLSIQVSLRELLPSESLRRRHSISDSEASPLDESHPSEHSPFSTAGEDSFFVVRLVLIVCFLCGWASYGCTVICTVHVNVSVKCKLHCTFICKRDDLCQNVIIFLILPVTCPVLCKCTVRMVCTHHHFLCNP